MLDKIEAMIKEKEELFNKISEYAQKKQEDHAKEMAELEAEMLRLQGEYRGLAELREQLLIDDKHKEE